MKITNISIQVRDKNRVNVSVDGKYRFSLDVFQLVDLGVRVGREYTEEELVALEEEAQFGKLYGRALEYSMTRPRSIREMGDYLWKKTRPSKRRSPKTGEIIERPGVSQNIADRVLQRLIDKGYLDDEKFARFWVDNRFARKGISQRRLSLELSQKGLDKETIEQAFRESSRSDDSELVKIVNKKRARYPDRQKFIQYLMRQGFGYDAVVAAIDVETVLD